MKIGQLATMLFAAPFLMMDATVSTPTNVTSSYSKTPLNKKQAKKRKAAKMGRKASRKNGC